MQGMDDAAGMGKSSTVNAYVCSGKSLINSEGSPPFCHGSGCSIPIKWMASSKDHNAKAINVSLITNMKK